MWTRTLIALATCLVIQIRAEDGVTTPMEAAASSQSAAKKQVDSERGVSTTITRPKPRTRVQGNFKGKDPMIAPDGEFKTKPTDGSRPSGNE